MKAALSAGVAPTGRRLSRWKCASASGPLSTSAIARLSLATMAGGVFGGAAIAFQALRDPNIIVIGLKAAPRKIEWRELRARARLLEQHYGLPFSRYVERLRTLNRWTTDELLIVPPAEGS